LRLRRNAEIWLRDGRDGNRFIINIFGRGYRFVASIKVPGDEN
jgi:DNA-binding winged helix-turn-helix (wHTH) protein